MRIGDTQADPSKVSERGKREDILRAAVESVVQEGYARTSVSEVARRAGVPRPLVQYYFPTRALLLRAAIDRILEEWRERYFPPPADPAEGVPDIREGVQRLWQHMHNPTYHAYRQLVSAARTDPGLCAILEELDPVDARRRHEQAASAYVAFATTDAVAFADARAFTTIFLEGLLQHRFGASDDSSTTNRQLAMLTEVLTRFWEERGAGTVRGGEGRQAPATMPESAGELGQRIDELISLLRPLSKSAG